ncbi:class I SAM-dependent methyltransferase [Luteolibacter sp. AS25]|uniref:class I SAM-dependent methyltransferase n=1 Tax=Luteolibacter sp. AS25 TaxID=3135776 RepID=UPI00398BAC82
MPPPRPTQLLHHFLETSVQAGETVIDATCGNGHDTLFLARLVGSSGNVIATDVQQQAIDSTRMRLEQELGFNNCSTHLLCHSRLREIAEPDSISAIVFNLGYLPGAAHELTTTPEKTVKALEAAVTLLRPGGSIGVVCYTGHPGGGDEAEVVEKFFNDLQNHQTARYGIVGTLKPAPFLLFSTKRSKQ